ncbi:MAG: DUF177 domain-containing protein [Candidatus Bipolaricaulota bacterium]
MTLSVAEFVAHPGRRFPLRVDLTPTEAVEDVRTVERIHLEGNAFAQLGTLYLDVTMTATISQPCVRCLAPIVQSFVLNEAFTVPLPPTADEVDVWPTATSLVLSAHDPNALCRPDCRGLCPTCGADLNASPDHVCDRNRTERRTLGEFFRR